jgi:hypothetical protein
VTEEELVIFNLRAAFHPGGRNLDPGTYTRLTRNGAVIMTDTPAEIRDHIWFVNRAWGHVLINGLGLGVCLQMVLEKPEVERVTVIEKSEDVIVLVAPSFSKDNRVQIILADAFEYQPPKGVRYGAVWHDIWDTICGDNLPSMHRLHRKYGRRTEWQNSWCRELCERSR